MRQKMVQVPETRDLLFRSDPNCGEKIVFFSEEAIDTAVKERRIPVEYANDLKAVLSRKEEEAAVLEWSGWDDWQHRRKFKQNLHLGHGG